MDLAQIIIVAAVVFGVLAFVVWPMVVSSRGPRVAAAHAVDDDRIEARIREYRAALRRRSVCDSCLFANVDGARFCAECGARIGSPGGSGL